MFRRIPVVLLLAGASLGLAGIAGAQTATIPATGPATSPTTADDAEHWFQAAREASAAGDLPAAVANLERVLLDNPNLSNIKLELGLLYLRLGQADLARGYLEAASAAPDAPEAARIRAREALRQASTSLSRFSASGVFQVGVQYQSNPNGSPNSVSIVGPGGTPVILSGNQLSVTRGDDVAGSISGSSELRYGLGGQAGTDLIATLAGSYTGYSKQNQIDTVYLGGQLGPRFLLGSALAPHGYLRPYGNLVYLGLGGARYFSGYGGGLGLITQLSPSVQFNGQIGYDRRGYHNSKDRPTSTDQTGDYFSGVGDLIIQADAKTLIDFGVVGERGSARRGYWSHDTFGASIGMIRNLQLGKLGAIGRLTFGYRHSRYDDPDPLVNAAVRRRENRYELGAGLGFPITRHVTLDFSAQRQWNPSNLPNYDYRNTVGSMSLSYRY